MNETGETHGGAQQARAPIDAFCEWIRLSTERAAELLTPPASATKHFRESKLEFWRGVRDLVDHRIDHLSRADSKGTRVPVD